MATFSSVTSRHVLEALAEHDARGADDFLAAHGYAASPDLVLVHEGRRYDARAVLAVAHRHATGRLATPDEFRSSTPQAVAVLRRRGFEVVGAQATRSAPARTATARSSRTPRTQGTPARRSPARTEERVAAVCPTCSMTLPATGICDDCG